MNNVLEYLEASAEKYGDEVAFEDEQKSITFSALKKEATRLTGILCKKVGKGSPIMVLMEKSVDTVICDLAVLYAGCYYIPLDEGLPVERMTRICQEVEASIMLVHAQSKPLAEKIGFVGEVLCVEEMAEAADAPQERWRQQCDVDPLFVIYTSGSTGKPKGVVLSHRSLCD